MKNIKNVIKVELKSTQITLFTITCKSERNLSEQELKDAVKFFYDRIYGNVEVLIVPEIGHFTDIRVIGKNFDLLLSWSFVSNIIF